MTQPDSSDMDTMDVIKDGLPFVQYAPVGSNMDTLDAVKDGLLYWCIEVGFTPVLMII